jgi:FKBP-type peptidyl-prolyl cis-trans isomerase
VETHSNSSLEQAKLSRDGIKDYWSTALYLAINISMCVGEKRKLVIPPDMAYGDRSMGPIKAGSTLGIPSHSSLISVFDVELIEIVGVPKPSPKEEPKPSPKEEL